MQRTRRLSRPSRSSALTIAVLVLTLAPSSAHAGKKFKGLALILSAAAAAAAITGVGSAAAPGLATAQAVILSAGAACKEEGCIAPKPPLAGEPLPASMGDAVAAALLNAEWVPVIVDPYGTAEEQALQLAVNAAVADSNALSAAVNQGFPAASVEQRMDALAASLSSVAVAIADFAASDPFDESVTQAELLQFALDVFRSGSLPAIEEQVLTDAGLSGSEIDAITSYIGLPDALLSSSPVALSTAVHQVSQSLTAAEVPKGVPAMAESWRAGLAMAVLLMGSLAIRSGLRIPLPSPPTSYLRPRR